MKLTVSIPIVRKNSNSWEKYRTDGTLEIHFEGGEIDEQQVNALLQKLEAQFFLIADHRIVSENRDELRGELANVREELKVARAQLNRVGQFLKGIGINPRDHLLRFDENLRLRSAETETECDDSGGSDDEDSDELQEDD